METPGKRTPSLKEDKKKTPKDKKKRRCIQEKEINKFVELLFGDKRSKQAIVIGGGRKMEKAIFISTDISLPIEGYRLQISPKQINIAASTTTGLFYALQSVRLLLPTDVERPQKDASISWKLPAMTIEDAPRFGYRGMMLDVARYFIPKETVISMIKVAAMIKINRLHFHLVDDNGWRVEIKGYPKLTEVGAWRVKREGPFSGRKNALPGEKATYGGFYTQEDIKEIVACATENHIEVIPEIEMPAHSNAALASYPELACPVVDLPITVIPGMGAYNGRIVYCAGNEKVFTFLEKVLDQVMELFPSSYVHLGGDEASKYYWERCPLCQKRMKEEKIENLEELQCYFMNRMARYVQSKGKKVMGWDEWTNGTMIDGAVILGWQGMGTAGYKAAKLGHNFIMTPSDILYFDYYQGPQWFEPRTYFGDNTLLRVYNYEPVQPEWEPEAAARLLGIQGSLWTEFLNKPDDVPYLLLPRLAALAETGWIPKGTKRWEDFLIRLDKLTERFDQMGMIYSRAMFNLDHQVTIAPNRTLLVQLSCIRPDVEIRYSTDGTEPTATSFLWNKTLTVTSN
ncbi:MAG: family 20 glycosylhydrolase, partial [Bacteroidaceae bacterium]